MSDAERAVSGLAAQSRWSHATGLADRVFPGTSAEVGDIVAFEALRYARPAGDVGRARRALPRRPPAGVVMMEAGKQVVVGAIEDLLNARDGIASAPGPSFDREAG